jgi:hypothetical protein
VAWLTLNLTSEPKLDAKPRTVAAAPAPTVQTVRLPADPKAVVLRMRHIDTLGERPDAELSITADGKVRASAYDTTLGTGVVMEEQLSSDQLQELMQFAVHDQYSLTLDPRATWKQLKKDYQFEGDQRAPTDTFLTELEVKTADNIQQLAWFQLASSEAWFHEVPAIRQMAALHRRLNNILLVMQAGGKSRVEPIAQDMTNQLRATYGDL